jgi:hypothetical protein
LGSNIDLSATTCIKGKLSHIYNYGSQKTPCSAPSPSYKKEASLLWENKIWKFFIVLNKSFEALSIEGDIKK